MSETQFIRVYKRKSKSPWEDSSTILLLAGVSVEGAEPKINFSRYIYLHRDAAGGFCGISVSSSIQEELRIAGSRYYDDGFMYVILCEYFDEIARFCELFSNEFERIFMLSPGEYFEAVKENWTQKLMDYSVY